MKVKYIDEKDGVEDELYTCFYVCPYCDHRNIITKANFCFTCGHKVYWKQKSKKRKRK